MVEPQKLMVIKAAPVGNYGIWWWSQIQSLPNVPHGTILTALLKSIDVLLLNANQKFISIYSCYMYKRKLLGTKYYIIGLLVFDPMKPIKGKHSCET